MPGVRNVLLVAGSSFLALCAINPAHAEEQASTKGQSPGAAANAETQLNEIIVTAQRRSENLQRTPIAVTALTAETLKSMNATSLNDIGNSTPSTLFNQNGGESIVFIRGIGQSDSVITADPGVAIYIDGVYVPRMFGDASDLLDVQRVEVLRGPQGTLFGKNTIGGAISITTRTPSLADVEGTIEARGGSRSRLDAGGYLSVPIVADKLAASIAVSSRSQDGYVNLPNVGTRGGDQHRQTARLKLYWKATDTLSFALASEYYHQREVGLPTQLTAVDPNAPLAALWNAFVGSASGSTFGTSGLAPKDTSYGTGQYYDNVDVRGVSLTSSLDVGPGTLKSITAYRYILRKTASDIDATPQPITRNPVEESSKAFTQELQYSGIGLDSRLHYVGGLFFLQEQAQDNQWVYADEGLYQALVNASLQSVANATDVTQNSQRTQRTRSFAAYGDVTFNLTSALSATAGVRYNRENKRDHLYFYYPNQDKVAIDKQVSQPFTSVTPKFGLNWQINDHHLAYASVSEGFKSGGINGRPTIDATVIPYKPEEVWSYEAGLKTQWLDNRLRINLAAYHMDYKDIQLQVVSTNASGALLITVENPGDARINGLEGEVTFRPIALLTVGTNIGYNDAHYTHLTADAPVTTSEKLPYNPRWTGAAYAQFSIPVGSDGHEIDVRGDYSFRSKYYLDVSNTENVAQQGYGIAGARISFLTLNRKLELYLYGTNLFNAYYKVFAIPEVSSFGWNAAGYAPPREVGGGVRFNF